MTAPLKVLRVSAGGRRFAIDAGLVRGVERPARRVRLPGAPDFVRGVVEVQGAVVVVIDLARRLGLEASAPAGVDPAVVVVESTEPIALAVDDPGSVAAVDAEALLDLGPAGAAAGLRGLLPDGAALLALEAVVDGRTLAPVGPVLEARPKGEARPAGDGLAVTDARVAARVGPGGRA